MIFLFYYLIILNFFDTLLTWFGLQYAFISELNPIMHGIYEVSPLLFLVIKTLLSIFLLLFILSKKVPQSSFIKALTVFATVFYTAVVFMHGFWLVHIF
ncbi:DUF5658 family protein [Bacillus sp. ISL-55]|uniref:DUF5658 family protein n=1 Tax=Bacillus sp. ISL-55 TaxID=2819134 RepID=UPI00336C24DD